MNGKLEDTFEKGGKQMTRRLNGDRSYKAADGSELSLKGRSLMLVRNVGHLMTNPAIIDAEGHEVPEGIMDAAFTSLIALHDIGANGRHMNRAKARSISSSQRCTGRKKWHSPMKSSPAPNSCLA